MSQDETEAAMVRAEKIVARADDIARRLDADFSSVLYQCGVRLDPEQREDVMTGLIEAAMHQCEHLLEEIP